MPIAIKRIQYVSDHLDGGGLPCVATTYCDYDGDWGWKEYAQSANYSSAYQRGWCTSEAEAQADLNRWAINHGWKRL